MGKAKLKAIPKTKGKDSQKKVAKSSGRQPKATPAAFAKAPPLEPTRFRELALHSRKFVGAHVSAAGGVENAVVHCASIDGESYAVFLKNQRRWDSPPLSDANIENYQLRSTQLRLEPAKHVLPHGSYLINLGGPDDAQREKSYQGLIDDLRRCHSLGITLYNLHPGSSTGKISQDESIAHIAKLINRAHGDVPEVVVVIENMSGQKNVIGSKFEDLRDIIRQVEDKTRIGVCLDTCHMFAAGFDVSTAEGFNKTLEEFDRIVGMSYLKAIHINDSKAALGSHLDRHEQLGKGHIGMECFRFMMNDKRFNDMPLVLETPEEELYRQEICLLYSLIEEEESVRLFKKAVSNAEVEELAEGDAADSESSDNSESGDSSEED